MILLALSCGSFCFSQTDSVNTGKTVKEKALDEVTVTGIRKEFIKAEADKVIFTVKNNDILEGGSLYDAVKKLPGVIANPMGGITINGRNAAIYIDGIPSTLSGQDLLNYLESLPANVVERIEVISTPGASYEANTGGGIINIITKGNALNGVNGTLNFHYGFNRNQKYSPSLLLNGRLKNMSWQMQTGYNYHEKDKNSGTSVFFTSFTPEVLLNSDSKTHEFDRNFYFRPSFGLKLSEKSRILFNYNMNLAHDNQFSDGEVGSQNYAPEVSLLSSSKLRNKNNNHEFILKSQNQLDTLGRTLDVTAYYNIYNKSQFVRSIQSQNKDNNYNINNLDLDFSNFFLKYDLSIPFKKVNLTFNTGAKYSYLSSNSLGEYNLNSSDASILENPVYINDLNFNYEENNLAVYAEVRKKLKKWSLVAGLRWEYLDSKSYVPEYEISTNNNINNLFPTFNVMYELNKMVSLTTSYSRKISMPPYSNLDPNYNGFFNQYSVNTGNPYLEPNFYDNYDIRLTAFNYLHLGAQYSYSKDINLLAYENSGSSLVTAQTYQTFHGVKNLTLYAGLPIPFGLITKGKEFFKQNLDPDKMSFVYLFGAYAKYKISDYEYFAGNSPIGFFGGMAQIVLPYDMKLSATYFHITKGTFQVYQVRKPIQRLDLNLSRNFFNKNLKIMLSVDDIFNQNAQKMNIPAPDFHTFLYSKSDSRTYWIKFTYNFGKNRNQQKENTQIEVDKKEIEGGNSLTPNVKQ
jgi:hypothetical protein